MRREESQYPEDWFRIGRKELERAKNLLGLGDLDGAGFNMQQAVEKFLKGYLLSKGWELERTHDLELLLNEAISYDPSLEEFRAACLRMTEYYVEERYPFTVVSELGEEEIRESLSTAEELINRLRELVK